MGNLIKNKPSQIPKVPKVKIFALFVYRNVIAIKAHHVKYHPWAKYYSLKNNTGEELQASSKNILTREFKSIKWEKLFYYWITVT